MAAAAAAAPIEPLRSVLLDALRLPGSTASALPGIGDDATVTALARRIEQLRGTGDISDAHSAPSLDLTIDGKSVLVRLPRDGVVPQVLAPLCLWLRGLLAAKGCVGPASGRVLVGVVGAAGAGKSYLCALLVALLGHPRLLPEDSEGQGGGCAVASLSMDAYHLPNAELEARGLMALKGNPETLGAAALVGDLRRLREECGEDVVLPIYDRRLHEPVAGGLMVTPAHRLVLVEGLHLLHRDDPAWAPVQAALDCTIFLDVPKSVCRERVVDRKVRNGRTRPDAEAHFHRVDESIFDRLQHDKEQADLVLHFPVSPTPTEAAAAPSVSSPSSSYNAVPTAVTLRGRLLSTSGPMEAGWEEARRQRLAGSARRPRILALGLNPCVQKVLRFEGPLQVGDVNRAVSVSAGVGGKGQNFTKAARLFGCARVTICQWLGGASGHEVEAALRTWDGVELVTQQVAGATRTCCSLLHRKPPPHRDPEGDVEGDEQCARAAQPAPSSPPPAKAGAERPRRPRPLTPFVLTTEVIEPGVPITPAEQDGLLGVLGAYIEQQRQDPLAAVAVMGSLPTGVAPAFYAKVLGRIWPLLLASRPVGAAAPVLFLDTVVGLEAILATGLPVTMLKVNAGEARGIVGVVSEEEEAYAGEGGEKGGEAREDRRFRRAVRSWLQRHSHVQSLAVTCGPQTARLFHLELDGGQEGGGSMAGPRLATYAYRLPFVSPHEVINPIGAGDACSAVTLSALLALAADQGEMAAGAALAAQSLRLGLAAATASCCKEENSAFDLPVLWAIAAAIRVEATVE